MDATKKQKTPKIPKAQGKLRRAHFASRIANQNPHTLRQFFNSKQNCKRYLAGLLLGLFFVGLGLGIEIKPEHLKATLNYGAPATGNVETFVTTAPSSQNIKQKLQNQTVTVATASDHLIIRDQAAGADTGKRAAKGATLTLTGEYQDTANKIWVAVKKPPGWVYAGLVTFSENSENNAPGGTTPNQSQNPTANKQALKTCLEQATNTTYCQAEIAAYTQTATSQQNKRILNGGCPGGGKLVAPFAGFIIGPNSEIIKPGTENVLDKVGSVDIKVENSIFSYRGDKKTQPYFTPEGCLLTPALDGPGLQPGLNIFSKFYRGNTSRSAIEMITGWTNFLLPFVSALAIAALIYAGFLYITAAGNNEQSEKAKKIIIWVVIGIILILSAYAIVNTLVTSNSGTGTGNSADFSFGGVDFGFDW